MTTQLQYRFVVVDDSDQKEAHISTSGDTLWAEVGAISVSRLGQPTHLGDEEVIYHLFDDTSGEALLPGQTVADVLRDSRADSQFRARLSPEMKPA